MADPEVPDSLAMPPPGPLATAIWRALPFLDPVPPGLPEGSAEEARAIDARAAGAHLCLLCGGPACAALIARARGGDLTGAPFWADVCAGCFAGLVAETPP